MNKVSIAINLVRCLFLTSILFLSSCSDSQVNAETEGDNTQIIAEWTKVDFEPEPYLSDTNLSNGYSLSYRVFKDSRFGHPIESLTLMKGTNDIIILNSRPYGYGTKQHYLGYIKADFGDTFAFLQATGGGGSPADIRVIDKATGTNLIEGVLVSINEKDSLLLYLRDIFTDTAELRLYDAHNKKDTVVDVREPVIDLYTVWDSWSEISVSNSPYSNEVILDYWREDEAYRKRYDR